LFEFKNGSTSRLAWYKLRNFTNNELYASGLGTMNGRTKGDVALNLSQWDEKSCYKRYFVLFIALVFFSLPFSEWRIFQYDLLKSHRLSFSDLLFLTSGIFMFVVLAWKGRISIFARQLSSLWPLVLLLLLMVMYFSDDTKITNSSISIYLIFGAILYMVLTTGLLLLLGNKNLFEYLRIYVLISAFLLIPIYVFTRFARLPLFMYGEGTKSLHFPFDNPNQAALFYVLQAILAVGILLWSKKLFWLYLVIPITILAAFQTGSRSGVLFLILSFFAFLVLFMLKWIFFKTRQLREISHFLLSSFVGSVLLFYTRTADNMRGLAIFRYNVFDMASGNVDTYRGDAWKLAISALDGRGAMTGQDAVNAMSGQDAVNLGGGLHNIYLDLWLNWGLMSFLSFLAFFAVLCAWSLKMLWSHRLKDDAYLYGALLIGVAVIAASLYANPLLHLKFIWAFLD